MENFMEEEIDQNFQAFPHRLQPRISKSEYLRHVTDIQELIQQGEVYEVNYCQEFYAEDVVIPLPLDAYFKLNHLTRAPYSSFFSIDNFNIFCGSPERFLKRIENRLVSEPIKGTKKRGKTEEEDEILKALLFSDPKERAENVMIVDLVRNDLSRVALPNSVEVEELYGIYTFETVHQMISKIACEVAPETTFTEILRATFPIGSMTGAPKISALKIIDEHECFQRGLYSGSIGYIKPNGNFDLNVVIRTLIYNKSTRYLSCAVGGAITSKSDPEMEYEECLIKVKGILDGMNE
jgi:para-aminobenzoate synthetase component 1